MKLQQITRSDDPLLDRILPLYESSFPQQERRPIEQLKLLLDTEERMVCNAVICEEKFCGLFIYWQFEQFYYLEYLAIYPELRNQKIGQQVLDYVARELTGLRLMEVEPPVDEITKRRIGYYQRNGYEVLNQDYIQPSYWDDCPAGNLWLMGNRHTERLQEYLAQIITEVYRHR
ncbi:MAG: GNAT family N-acetyltransferase [Alistipes sp.]